MNKILKIVYLKFGIRSRKIIIFFAPNTQMNLFLYKSLDNVPGHPVLP